MKIGEEEPIESKEAWFDAHPTLGEGARDFSHFSTDRLGHAIHEEDPVLVIEYLERLLKLID